MSVLGELKRRKMFQVIAVYAVVAWLVVQIVTSIEQPLNLPDWTDTLFIVLLALGFPVMLVVSWAFNVTPGGVVRDQGDEEAGRSPGRTIEFVLIGLVGIAVVWLIYRTEFDSQPPPETIVVEESAPDVLPNSVAVLPFANLSPDPDNAFFAAGIHDTILNELAKIRDMHVISRTTMIRYADTEKSMSQIAEELRVETVMEGSIQYANGRVLVTAQLIDPKTDSHLWSDNYDRNIADVFAIQADIATHIAEALQARITPEERQSIQQQMTDSPQAYAAYLQAMELAGWNLSPGDSDNTEIQTLLDKAIEIDPNFARAYAVKAYLLIYRREHQQESELISTARQALQLDPALGLAHIALAVNHHFRMRDSEARQAFDKALSLNPNDPNVMDEVSRYLVWSGEFEAAIALAARLGDINPGFRGLLSYVTWLSGDLQASLREARRGVELDSASHSRRISLAIRELLAGNALAAQAETQIAISLHSFDMYDDLRIRGLARDAYRYRLLGHDEMADRLLERLFAKAEFETLGPTAGVYAYSATGNYEKVMEQLQLAAEGVENGYLDYGNARFAANAYADPILETPEFVEVRRRLGFPNLVDR